MLSILRRAAGPLLAIAVAACSGSNPTGIVGMSVSPASVSLDVGEQAAFTVVATLGNGTRIDVTGDVSWSASNASRATISGPTATAIAPGSLVIMASHPNTSLVGTATVVVNAGTLTSIELDPPAPQLANGTQLDLTATGVFDTGGNYELTDGLTWSTSNASVVDVVDGRLTANAPGTATITVTDTASSITGNVLVTVTAAFMVSIDVSPASVHLAMGNEAPLTATATFSDSTVQDVTSTVTWTTDDGSVAAFSSTPGEEGLLRSVSPGSTDATATDAGSGTFATVSVLVTQARMESMEVSPANEDVPAGRKRQFTATGTYSDSTTRDVTEEVDWTSSNDLLAPVSNLLGTHGEVLGLGLGTVLITATDPVSGETDSATLTITAAVLDTLTLTPSAPTVVLGVLQPFTATGTFSDASVEDLTDTVTFSSNLPLIATVSNAAGTSGVATTLGVGTATITAVDPSTAVTDSVSLVVSPATLVSLDVTPGSATLPLLATLFATATGTYSDASTHDLTDSVTWSSTAPLIASVGNAAGIHGLVTGLGIGGATITAVHPGSGLNDSLALGVSSAALVSIDVTPTDPSIANGSTRAFTATGNYSDMSTEDLTDDVTWTSSLPGVATVSNASGSEGVASSVSAGTTTVTATHAATAIDGSTTLTVTSAVLVSIEVTPATASVTTLNTQQFTATGHYSDASTQDLTDSVTWSSNVPAVASISNAGGSEGLATGLVPGSATITATHVSSGLMDDAAFTVTLL